jgi:MFS transporter, DHA1 family, multidrug resistance protein
MLVIGVAPLLAPTAGGLIAGWWGWRATFVVLAVLGLALIPVIAWALPETLPRAARRREPLAASFAGYGHLVRDRRFMALAVLPGLALGALMSYVAGSPFVLQEGYGLSETEFALLFAINGVGLVLGSQLNASLVRRFEPVAVLGVMIPLAAVLGVVLLVLVATGTGGLVGLIVPLWFLLSTTSFIMPNATALALTLHGERAGTAAALIGALQAGIAGTVSPIVGLLGGDDVAMAVVILAAVTASLLVFLVAGRAHGRAVA